MTKFTEIKIENISDLYLFVDKASQIDGDIIVKRGKFAVDGKSLLGVLSLDMSQGAVVIYPESALEFDSFCQYFKTNN